MVTCASSQRLRDPSAVAPLCPAPAAALLPPPDPHLPLWLVDSPAASVRFKDPRGCVWPRG